MQLDSLVRFRPVRAEADWSCEGLGRRPAVPDFF